MRPMLSRAIISGSLVLALVVCLTTSVSAEMRFGATAGLNRSSLGGDKPDGASYNPSVGFGFGVVGDIGLTKDVVLSVQPMYVRRGTNIAFDVGEEVKRDSLEVRVDYIDCLVLVKVLLDNERFYFSSGLGFGFLTGAKINDIHDGESDAKSLFRDYDISVAMGVGYVIPARRSLVTIELRYQQSLVSVADPDALPSESGLSARTRFSGLQVLATVLFPRNHE